MSLGSVYISYVTGVSEMFRSIGSRYSIGKIFRTKHTLTRSVMKPRHSVSTAIPVNVAEATLARSADF
jgi:putative effector of murein hydrolase